MSTTFPGVFDSYSLKADNVDIVQAAHVNNLQDAIVALEGQFSVDGNVGLAEGRLTLSNTDPAPIADQTAKTTVYYFPYVGHRIAIYNTVTTGWDVLKFGSASVSVPATTSRPFDVFAYNNAGTLALQTVNWTNDTTRATAITRQDGIWCKSGDLGKRYLGTGRTGTVSGQTEDSDTKRFLWNYYNRVEKRLTKYAPTSHTYNTSTWRAWNNTTADTQVSWVTGVVEEHFLGNLWCGFGKDTATDGQPLVAIGVNTTTSPIGRQMSFATGLTLVLYVSALNAYTPQTGYNYMVCVEYSTVGATAADFYEVLVDGIVKC